MQAVCRMCGETIVFAGAYWDHMGENKPRHPALPAHEITTGAAAPVLTESLDERELLQVLHARSYADGFAKSGVPGHGQFLLIAKLSRMIDELRAIKTLPRVQQLAWYAESNCWRDLRTGVRVELHD